MIMLLPETFVHEILPCLNNTLGEVAGFDEDVPLPVEVCARLMSAGMLALLVVLHVNFRWRNPAKQIGWKRFFSDK